MGPPPPGGSFDQWCAGKSVTTSCPQKKKEILICHFVNFSDGNSTTMADLSLPIGCY